MLVMLGTSERGVLVTSDGLTWSCQTPGLSAIVMPVSTHRIQLHIVQFVAERFFVLTLCKMSETHHHYTQ